MRRDIKVRYREAVELMEQLCYNECGTLTSIWLLQKTMQRKTWPVSDKNTEVLYFGCVFELIRFARISFL
jgi:hypothetical protein